MRVDLRKIAMEHREPLRPQNDCLSVEVTTHCNSSCSHCFVRARGGRRASLSLDLVRTLLQEGYEAGYRHLHVTGGEPLMWDSLVRMLDHAFTLGYQTVFLNTNGTLLTRDTSRKLATYSGLAISVSIQGPPPFHDVIRGKGSYNRALRGIDNALAAGLPVHIFTTVGRSLLPDVPRFAGQLFSDFPAIKKLTLIQLVRVQNDVFDLSKELLAPDDFLALVRIACLLALSGLNVDILNNPLAATASKVLRMPWLSSSPPLYHHGNVMITADRRITIAHSTTEHLGFYEQGALARIINSHAYCDAISSCQLLCHDCSYGEVCGSNELMRPSEWDKDMFPEIPFCRRVLAKASSYG